MVHPAIAFIGLAGFLFASAIAVLGRGFSGAALGDRHLWKLYAYIFVTLPTAFVYGMYGLGNGGAGHEVISGHLVIWSQYSLYAITHPLFYALLALSLDEEARRAVVFGLFGLVATVSLIWSARTDVSGGDWYWAIPAILACVLSGFYLALGLGPDATRAPKNLKPIKSNLVKIAFWLLSTYYVIRAVIDAYWTNAIKGDENKLLGADLAVDIIFKGVFGLYVLFAVDVLPAPKLFGLFTGESSAGYSRMSAKSGSGGNALSRGFVAQGNACELPAPGAAPAQQPVPSTADSGVAISPSGNQFNV